MEPLYHIVAPTDWQSAADPYRAPSLDSEGFIHCSYAHQVARVANLFYRQADRLLLLHIDPGQLACPVRAEDPGVGELFPHVYGPIPRGAVREVLELQRGPGGEWQFPSS